MSVEVQSLFSQHALWPWSAAKGSPSARRMAFTGNSACPQAQFPSVEFSGFCIRELRHLTSMYFFSVCPLYPQ